MIYTQFNTVDFSSYFEHRPGIAAIVLAAVSVVRIITFAVHYRLANQRATFWLANVTLHAHESNFVKILRTFNTTNLSVVRMGT